MPEKHSRAMPPMTPPIIAPVLFAEESPLLVLPLPPLVSFAGAGLVGSGVLPEDAPVDLDDDENALVVVCVAVGVVGEDDWSVVDVVSEIGLVGLESAVGEMR